MPLVSGNRIAKKKFGPVPPLKVQQKNYNDESSDGFSDEDEEDQKDYRVGGYHPVEIGEVFSERYKVLCKMGWGQYSTVWLVRDLNSARLFALKIQKSATAYMEAAQDELRLFKEVMKNVDLVRKDNPNTVVNIVELHDNFLFSGVNGTHMCFVYERLGGSLLDLIKHYNYKGIPSWIVRKLTQDMLSGLSFLHKCGIIHTDVKPENVLLTAPVMEPPPEQTTMFDLLQEQIQKNPEVMQLQAEIDREDVSLEEKKRLRMKLRKLRTRIKKSISNNKIPSLWGFTKFNYSEQKKESPAEEVREQATISSLHLTPSTWKYPDDCFYIKMYITAPLPLVKSALGPRHGFGDSERDDHSLWTFHFEGEEDGAVNMFQLCGHGRDKHTRLHDIRHILMGDFTLEDQNDHHLWSLRFDGRRIRMVFSILESLIPGFTIIHLPKTKFSLSAYEHSMIANAGKEFLPPETRIFRDVNGILVGLVIPTLKEGLELLPLEERLSMWPSDAMMSKALSNNRTIPPYFGAEDSIGCKVVDLGNACFQKKPFTNDIQTRQYRCPETILHTPYSYSADIWSAACVIFELLTGDFLFQPHEHGNVSRDLEHLALFEEYLGRIPYEFAKTGKKHREFFNAKGELKFQKKLAPHKIAYKLHKKGLCLEEAALIEDLMLKMLCYIPSERLDAEACLQHPWFSYCPDEQNERNERNEENNH